MKHLVYLAWSAAAAGYLFVANSRGWSLVHTMSPARLFSSSGHGSGFHHK
ncbi:hypothetical protein [Luteolibacter sp. LG18]|nr:hypothetical protein llg_17610 [Luteolibacter sp. LG18]